MALRWFEPWAGKSAMLMPFRRTGFRAITRDDNLASQFAQNWVMICVIILDGPMPLVQGKLLRQSVCKSDQ